MSLILTSSVTAMATGRQTSFLASGGVAPYVYSIAPGGAGGTINPSTGLYTAPLSTTGKDNIIVTDATLATATKSILSCTPLELFCDILQTEMGLAQGRVYLWDQKIDQPKDNGLYIAVGVLSCKPFGNNTPIDGSGAGLNAVQSVNMFATLSVDIISRGPEARDRKEEVIMALNSIYSQSQQEANSFYIAKISSGFNNLSNIDGAAIPYRFNISVNMQYFVTKTKAVPYFDDFAQPGLTINI